MDRPDAGGARHRRRHLARRFRRLPCAAIDRPADGGAKPAVRAANRSGDLGQQPARAVLGHGQQVARPSG